jgi:hypothetical protein
LIDSIDQLLQLSQIRSGRLDLIGPPRAADFDSSRGDLDFVVEFSNFTVENADRYLRLMVDLEDLFGRRIDLVSYRASAIRTSSRWWMARA